MFCNISYLKKDFCYKFVYLMDYTSTPQTYNLISKISKAWQKFFVDTPVG